MSPALEYDYILCFVALLSSGLRGFKRHRSYIIIIIISKIVERIVYNQLYSYLTTNKMLFKSQYGFRKSHSTDTAAIELTDTLLQNLDNCEIPIAILFISVKGV